MPQDRTILAVTGRDAADFLQGLVTNDVAALDRGPVYAALLTPQGKYLADFLMLRRDGAILLDVASTAAEALARRLGLYRLRAAVEIAPIPLEVRRGTGDRPDGALADPRGAGLGWRLYGGGADDDGTDWDAVRVAGCVPETGIELVPDESYILEAGFERLHGVDFRKGCYVGQEVTARMKHKTELRKGLATVEVEGSAPTGTEIVSGERSVGQLYTQSGGRGIAYLRFDRAEGALAAGPATVRYPRA